MTTIIGLELLITPTQSANTPSNQQLINSLTGTISRCDLDSVHTPPLIEPGYDLKH